LEAIVKLAPLLSTFALTLACAAGAHAQDTAITFRATVASVSDPLGLLPAGLIAPGAELIGIYSFDTSTPDTNPAPRVGDYWHTTTGNRIRVEACGVVFRTDPSNVQLLMEMVNNHGTPASDNYLLRSCNNVSSLSTFTDHIS
jgi:hypothetical protein